MWKYSFIVAAICLTAGWANAQDDALRKNLVDALTIMGNPTTKPLKLEKGTYLGIAASNIPAALRAQLQLKPGVGLIVDRVEKNSPAEQAGVQQYDILEKLEEQWLINPQQFAVVVRMQEVGKEVKLSIIRQGQPQVIAARLIEKEVAPVGSNTIWIHDENMWKNDGQGFLEMVGPLQSGSGRFIINKSGTKSITRQDNGIEFSLTQAGDNINLKASDAAGNLLFDGPVDTEQQWEHVPPDVARVARKMAADMKRGTLEIKRKP
jgi:hypothetical protein